MMSASPIRPDPEHPRAAEPFDQPDGYSGQDYTIERERAAAPPTTPPVREQADGRDLPPDTGHRARIDGATGAVSGSGAGIGGGNPGEDFDSATPSGDTYPLTGGESTDHAPVEPGPPHFKE